MEYLRGSRSALSPYIVLIATLLLVACFGCDRRCPLGSDTVGARPPGGLEEWCQTRTDNGDFVKVGVYQSWYENNQQKAEMTFNQNRPHGEAFAWHPNGKRAFEGVYGESGLLDGWVVVYYPNGIVRFKAFYSKGLPNGDAFINDETGAKLMEQKATNEGERSVRVLSPGGNLVATITYNTDGKKNGSAEYFHPNGQLGLKALWKQGTLVEAVQFHSNGNPFVQRIQSGQGWDVSVFYVNGAPRIRTVTNGTGKITEMKLFNKDGVLIEESTSEYNKRYYENGQIQKITNLKTKETKTFHPDGKVDRGGDGLYDLRKSLAQNLEIASFEADDPKLELKVDNEIAEKQLMADLFSQLQVVGANFNNSNIDIFGSRLTP